MRKVAVIGLGRFGLTLARRLSELGAEVIAVDRNAQLVQEVKDDVDVAVRLDSTDEAALTAQDVHKVDVLVVAIGENFEASLLTTVIGLRLGIPKVICRAQTAVHAEIFRQIGAHEVIQPEAEVGATLARRLASTRIRDFIRLAEGFTLLEMNAPGAFHGKSLQDLSLRTRYGVNLVALSREQDVPEAAADRKAEPARRTEPERRSFRVPQADDVLRDGDILILVGSEEDLARLPKE